MQSFRADLHIHSVLSPCGGLEMSPSALVMRFKELGITWFAITDHNSMGNCPAYAAVAQKAGLSFTWGVEIQTVEEVHLLAYFDDPSQARAFDQELYRSLLPLENDPEFFGDQVIIDENENILRVESRALINSSLWDLATATQQISAFGGLAVPAHIDADVNSIISQLGFLPPSPDFELLGITAKLDLPRYLDQHPELAAKAFIRASDAHYLADIGHGSCIIRVQEPTAQEILRAARKTDGRYINNDT
ncbi:MAG: PHP domain-containing protein [Candidatus Cloacimonetes bacterium]|nr:PHP domain-containing protein [Candidatus Cloacimonadota bacterium]MDD2423912.1 PHP domain-containing protein [Candidatus Cloacimonadota bacterium]MDD3562863.1 PHP domain-containing protein [Candidatus Cloacimonadota bacterium]MDD4277499.1 PHP domain-containing protein [Candidatus Cloacimonadota bacterium]MDY0326100.1 PHP domain-containing protein [Candidatus Cloacimonadaceae bacterium]